MRRHKLTGKRSRQWAVDLAGGDRICFSPAGDAGPETPPSEITVICIEFIGDYHNG